MSLLYLFLTKCHHPVLPADRLWRISPSKAHWSSQQTVQVLNFSSDEKVKMVLVQFEALFFPDISPTRPQWRARVENMQGVEIETRLLWNSWLPSQKLICTNRPLSHFHENIPGPESEKYPQTRVWKNLKCNGLPKVRRIHGCKIAESDCMENMQFLVVHFLGYIYPYPQRLKKNL